MTELHSEVQFVFEVRYAELVAQAMRDLVPLVNQIESEHAADALTELDEDMSFITGLLDTTSRNPGKLLDLVCDLLQTLTPYLNARGLFEEQLSWAQRLFKYFRDHAESEEAAVNLSLLMIIASTFHRLGEHDDALDIYSFVLSIDRHRSTHPGFAIAHHSMALIYLSKGDHASALSACQRALEIDRHNENPRGIANGLLLLADLLEEEGALPASADALREATDIIEEIRNPILEATLLSKIAIFAAKYNPEANSDRLFKEAIEKWQSIGDDEQLALTKFNYAVVLQETGKPDEARQHAVESLKLLEAARHFRANHVRQAIEAWDRGEDAPASIPLLRLSSPAVEDATEGDDLT